MSREDKARDAQQVLREARHHPVAQKVNGLYHAVVDMVIALQEPGAGSSTVGAGKGSSPSGGDVTPTARHALAIEWLAEVEDMMGRLREERPRRV